MNKELVLLEISVRENDDGTMDAVFKVPFPEQLIYDDVKELYRDLLDEAKKRILFYNDGGLLQ